MNRAFGRFSCTPLRIRLLSPLSLTKVLRISYTAAPLDSIDDPDSFASFCLKARCLLKSLVLKISFQIEKTSFCLSLSPPFIIFISVLVISFLILFEPFSSCCWAPSALTRAFIAANWSEFRQERMSLPLAVHRSDRRELCTSTPSLVQIDLRRYKVIHNNNRLQLIYFSTNVVIDKCRLT